MGLFLAYFPIFEFAMLIHGDLHYTVYEPAHLIKRQDNAQ